jgi:hypothetical protein
MELPFSNARKKNRRAIKNRKARDTGIIECKTQDQAKQNKTQDNTDYWECLLIFGPFQYYYFAKFA